MQETEIASIIGIEVLPTLDTISDYAFIELNTDVINFIKEISKVEINAWSKKKTPEHLLLAQLQMIEMYEQYADTFETVIKDIPLRETSGAGPVYTASMQTQFVLVTSKRIPWFLVWNPAQFYSIYCSYAISGGSSVYSKVTEYPLSSNVRYISITNNSCFCDTLLEYIFGFTDLFDFGFKDADHIDAKFMFHRDIKVRSDSTPLPKLGRNPATEKIIERFLHGHKNTTINQENMELFFLLQSRETRWDNYTVNELAMIRDYIRGATYMDLKTFEDIKEGIMEKARLASTSSPTQFDYIEFLEFIMSILGISSFVQPKVIARTYIKIPGSTEKLHIHDFIIGTNTYGFRTLVGKSGVLNAFDPSESFRAANNLLEKTFKRMFSAYSLVHIHSNEMYVHANTYPYHWADANYAIDSQISGYTIYVVVDVINAPVTFYVRTRELQYQQGAIYKPNIFKDLSENNLEKMNKPVIYSSHILGLEYEYLITGIVCHSGSQSNTGTSGHWWTWIRDPRTGNWFKYNDTDVKTAQSSSFNPSNRNDIYLKKNAANITTFFDEITKKAEVIWYTRRDVFESMLTRFGQPK
jgi:hypothetical protein